MHKQTANTQNHGWDTHDLIPAAQTILGEPLTFVELKISMVHINITHTSRQQDAASIPDTRTFGVMRAAWCGGVPPPRV